MVSQFKSPHRVPLLGSLGYPFAEGTHAIGRLDKDSEGLLLLTTNKQVTRLLFQSPVPHSRTYLVQLKKSVDAKDIQQLEAGVPIIIKNADAYIARVVEALPIDRPLDLLPLPHNPFESASHSWLQLTLTEGKFHQVRKMMTSINNRCLRLIRLSIEELSIENILPGQIKEIGETEFFSKLKIDQNII